MTTTVQLIERVSKKSGVPKSQVSMIVDTLLSCIGDALLEGDKVQLRGFLTLKTVRSPRINMFKTGKVVGGLRRVSMTLPRKSKWKHLP